MYSKLVATHQSLRHALYSPITALSLLLNELSHSQAHSPHDLDLVKQAQKATKYIEQLVYLTDKSQRRNIIECTLETNIHVAIGLVCRLDQTVQVKTNIDIPNAKMPGPAIVWQEVIRNLIANAAQAYRQFRKSKLVVIQAYKQNNMGVIEVTDFGRGMSLWQQLLVKYFHITTKPHGHGIGLDYVNQATKMFGGQVKISSGGGSTTVKVSYPWSGNIYPKPRTVLISNDSPKATRNLLI